MKTYLLSAKRPLANFNENDQSLDINKFLENRFEVYAPNFNCSILTGSNSLYVGKQLTEQHYTCDSATIAQSQTKEKVNTVLAATVADGLGYEENDPKYNESLGIVANFCCEQFLQDKLTGNIEKTTKNLLQLAERSKDKVLKDNKNSPYESNCSLATTVIKHHKGNWSADITNTGDGMVVVLDSKTLKIKHSIDAKLQYRGFGVHSPLALQELTADKVQEHHIAIDEGDFVLAMTDGMYTNFKLNKRHNDETKDINLSLDVDDFAKVIEGISPANISSYELGCHLLQVSNQNHLIKFNMLAELIKKIEFYISESNLESFTAKMSINKFLSHLKDNNKQLHDEFYAFVHNDNLTDGVSYNLDKCEIGFMLNHIKKQEFGDCTTLAVLKVPNYKQELLRAAINEHKLPAELENLIKKNINASEIDEICNLLSSEQIPAKQNSTARYGKLEMVSRYTEQQISNCKNLVENCLKKSSFLPKFSGLCLTRKPSTASQVCEFKDNQTPEKELDTGFSP